MTHVKHREVGASDDSRETLRDQLEGTVSRETIRWGNRLILGSGAMCGAPKLPTKRQVFLTARASRHMCRST
ncbi:hypothetical protein BQ8794_170141 [Mesorhizobium prunaredense]|uniref:Uncharacterized protein n=1 Tax=Mesorhizobium prunaredense TaxID=1631249 RepID=A0A1R3V5Y4_9HYPH|nr:hypothetical protein BQ8794_170141 [Mesorhizobium prunaredense]